MTAAASSCHAATTRSTAPLAVAIRATPTWDSSLCHLQNGSTRGRIPRLLRPPLTPHYHNRKPSRSSGILLQTGNSIGASVGAATESSSEELMAGPPPPQHQQHQFIVSRKRIRTKFTAEQREGMLAFAEQDGAAVEQFCCEVGVRRKVFITTR